MKLQFTVKRKVHVDNGPPIWKQIGYAVVDDESRADGEFRGRLYLHMFEGEFFLFEKPARPEEDTDADYMVGALGTHGAFRSPK